MAIGVLIDVLVAIGVLIDVLVAIGVLMAIGVLILGVISKQLSLLHGRVGDPTT